MSEIIDEPLTVDDIFALSLDALTEMIDSQYRRDFKGAKTDDEVMRIRMSI